MKNRDVFLRVKDCSYVVLDQRKAMDHSQRQLYESFFSWWEHYWNEILKSVGISEAIDHQEFIQQHKITALLYKNEIVSMHLLSVFEKEQFLTHPYFQKFNRSFIDKIISLNINKILTLQYLALDQKYKKEKPFIYFPMTIGSLSILHQKTENAQATISVARKDLGVSNALSKMNFTALQEDGIYNNTPVSFQIAFDPKVYPSEVVKDLTLNFWNNKNEITNNISDKEVA